VRPEWVAVWGVPKIRSTADAEEQPVSLEEQRLREAQLRAIGYAQ